VRVQRIERGIPAGGRIGARELEADVVNRIDVQSATDLAGWLVDI
jgi:hypothetical protein